MKRQIFATLLLSPWLLSSASAQLDFFTSPDQAVSLDGKAVGGTASNSQPVVLGGVSTTRVFSGMVTTASAPVGATMQIFEGLVDIGQGSGDGAEFAVAWGSAADLNLDLTSFGEAFSFTHAGNDGVAGSEITITVWNEGIAYTSPVTTLTHTNFDSSMAGYDYTIPFSAFTPGVDFTNVDRIVFGIKPAVSADLQFTGFRVPASSSVPEPGGLVLTGLTGMAALLRRKRP